ncbi:hypothetical protein lerEdw1_015220 [Lerista edwardsae]|nr:hypothetical protein lerEdw1_015221 [Lerista edwardsae]KAJ6610932.1 hypothetical protein lerEdw1_015220 [Lerista edwardsae]
MEPEGLHGLPVINNYLEGAQLGVTERTSPGGMHFRDSKRKVDYVLVYHYRKRILQADGGTPGHPDRPASLAIISNGETAKSQPEQQQQQQQHGQDVPHPDAQVIDLGPLDPLEEARREQREEFEHNLTEAGLEIEKDVECLQPGDLTAYRDSHLETCGGSVVICKDQGLDSKSTYPVMLVKV